MQKQLFSKNLLSLFLFIFSFILITTLSIFTPIKATANDEDWTKAALVLRDRGVINGYGDGSFRPKNLVTRGEMAKFILNAMTPASNYEFANVNQQKPANTNLTCANFSDVDIKNTFYEAITTLKCNQIINGYPDGTYKPENQLNYQELAKYLIESSRFSKKGVFRNETTKFKSLSEYYETAMIYLGGKETEKVTREQMATAVYMVFELGQYGVPKPPIKTTPTKTATKENTQNLIFQKLQERYSTVKKSPQAQIFADKLAEQCAKTASDRIKEFNDYCSYRSPSNSAEYEKTLVGNYDLSTYLVLNYPFDEDLSDEENATKIYDQILFYDKNNISTALVNLQYRPGIAVSIGAPNSNGQNTIAIVTGE